MMARAGEVFAIPVDEERVGFGQVVPHPYAFYVIIFQRITERPVDVSLAELVQDEIALFGQTSDVSLEHGEWKVVGKVPDFQELPRPYYHVYREGKDVLEDFEGNYVRDATMEDTRYYESRTSHSPDLFAQALKALHGIDPWEAEFEQISIEHAWRQALDLANLESQ